MMSALAGKSSGTPVGEVGVIGLGEGKVLFFI